MAVGNMKQSYKKKKRRNLLRIFNHKHIILSYKREQWSGASWMDLLFETWILVTKYIPIFRIYICSHKNMFSSMVHRDEFSEKRLTNQSEEKEKSDCSYIKTL